MPLNTINSTYSIGGVTFHIYNDFQIINANTLTKLLENDFRLLLVNDVDFKELTLYPNPVENSLNIVSDDEIEKIEIYDVQGRKINVEKMKNNINFTTFNKGIYFLKIFTKNRVSTNKVIKI